MRSKLFYFAIAISLFLISCKPSYTNNPTILRAESKLFESPDSAYQLLCSIKQPKELPEADYAAWCLHYTHARYKLYIDDKSDSLIRFASNYYQKNGPDKYAGTALYLQGCLAELEKKKSLAMKLFKMAVQTLEDTDEYNITGLTLFKISHIYLSNELYTESENYINKAIDCFNKSKNKTYLYYSYRTKSEILYKLEKPTNAVIEEINKSEKYARECKDTAFCNELIIFRGKILVETDRLTAKMYFLTAYSKLNIITDETNAYLSYIYSKEKQADSALYYFNRITCKDSVSVTKFMYEVINLYLAESEKNYKKAYHHLENAFNIKEDIYKQNNKELIVRIDKQYDFSKKEQERAQLEIANQQKIILITALCILILVGVIVQLQIQNRHKQKHNKMELEHQLLQFEINSRKSENEQNIKLLQANIQNKIENTLKFKRLNIGLSKKEKVDDFISEITQQSVVSEKELNYYMLEADRIYGNRISGLKIEFPKLTFSDLIVISLISLGIDSNNCCILLDTSINTLYMRRKRIKKHLGIDKSVELEQWIKEKIIVE